MNRKTEPRQAKVIYVKAVTDDRNEIIDLRCDSSDVYLNNVNSLNISFNDLDFDTNDLRIFEKEISSDKIGNPMNYKEFKEDLLVDGFYDPLVDSTIIITDSNYEHKVEINVYNI